MSDANFNAILDTPVEEIKARPPLPVGTYDWRIQSLQHVTSSKKKTPGIEFTCVPFRAHDDVDQEMLSESGMDRELRHTLYITPDSANMVKEFLVNDCGMNGTGKTLRQLLADAKNQTFAGIVTHGTSDKGNAYAQIGQTMRIE